MREAVVRLLKQALETHVEISTDEMEQLLVDQRIMLALDKNKAELLTQRGDFSLPIFKFAKQLKKNPFEFAKQVVNSLQELNENLEPRIISKCWADGGYVNLQVSSHLENAELHDYLDLESLLKPKDSIGKRVLIEHTSVNPGKPWHIGHARNAILGDALARIYRYLGWDVEVQNYIDDLGRQVAVTLWGMKRIADDLRTGNVLLREFLTDVDSNYINELQDELKNRSMKEDLFQGIVYVWATQQAERDQSRVQPEIEEIMKAMEHRHEPIASEARNLALESILAQLKTAWRLGIYYDYLVWESDLIEAGVYDEALKAMLETPNVYEVEEGEDKGCIVINFEGFKGISAKKPYKILVRSNGVATYVAKDIAYTFWKFGLTNSDLKFKPLVRQPSDKELFTSDPDGRVINRNRTIDQLINVVGQEQTYAQKIVFYALKVMGHEREYAASHHLAYNLVELAHSKISGRKGNWIGSHADRVLDLTYQRALEELRNRNPDQSMDVLKDQAERLTISQLRYFMIRPQLNTKIVYDPDEVANFQGDNGAFVLYSLIRAKSIVKKLSLPEEFLLPSDVDFTPLERIEERILIKDILITPHVLEKVIQLKDPSHLAQHAFILAKDFNTFYNSCPIKNEPDPRIKKARTALLFCFINTMTLIVNLLGMPIPEFM